MLPRSFRRNPIQPRLKSRVDAVERSTGCAEPRKAIAAGKLDTAGITLQESGLVPFAAS